LPSLSPPFALSPDVFSSEELHAASIMEVSNTIIAKKLNFFIFFPPINLFDLFEINKSTNLKV
jgi:hypothetical protein